MYSLGLTPHLFSDQISDFLFTPSPDANENLKKEGIPEEKIFLVGNVTVDSLLYKLEKAQKSPILYRLGLTKLNRANPMNSMNSMSQINQINQIDQTDEIDQTDQIDENSQE